MGRKGRDETKADQWRKRITEALRSGLSVREFCRRQGVPEAQFYSWRRKLSDRKGRQVRRRRPAVTKVGQTFALVTDGTGALEQIGVELVWADGRRLRIGPGVDEATLRTVLAVVESGRC
jgi:transposase